LDPSGSFAGTSASFALKNSVDGGGHAYRSPAPDLNAEDAKVIAEERRGAMDENAISRIIIGCAMKLRLIINFNVEHLRDGIKRAVNGL
jgi:hypothetical protein